MNSVLCSQLSQDGINFLITIQFMRYSGVPRKTQGKHEQDYFHYLTIKEQSEDCMDDESNSALIFKTDLSSTNIHKS